MLRSCRDRCEHLCGPRLIEDARKLLDAIYGRRGAQEYPLERFLPSGYVSVDQIDRLDADFVDEPIHNVDHVLALKRCEVAKDILLALSGSRRL